MISQDVKERFMRTAGWAAGPTRWAVRLRLAPGPFKARRKLPLKCISRLVELQLLTLIAIEKIAR